MAELINSRQVQEFLKDFKENSETILLEEGKEVSELFEIAEARGIKLKDNRDLAGVKFIYTFADEANKNRARLPMKELLKALPTLVGKPLDIDHARNFVIGHFLDYRWIVKDKKVIAYAVIYKSNFADEWEEMQNLFRQGRLTTSYEIWSDHSKRKVLEDGTYELYDMTIAGGAILLRENPAFPGAKVLEMAKDRMANSKDLVFASEYKDADIITAKDNISKADELNKDKSAIQTVVKGEQKVETKEEVKVEVAVETPKVEAPKTEEKIAEATVPPVEEKKIEEPVKAEEPKAEEPKVEEKKVVEPAKVEETKVEDTPAVEAKVEEPKQEEPKPEETAKVDEPKAEEPKVEEPKVEETAKVEEKVEAPKEEAKVEEPTPEAAKECEDCKKHQITIADLETKVEFYKKNSVEIATRRAELGEFAKEISDVDILDEQKFSDAKVVKANAELEKSAEVVGTKEKDVDNYQAIRKEIDEKAYGGVKRNH